jgi:MFS family permease
MTKHLFLYTKAFSDIGTIMELVVVTSVILVMTHHNVVWLAVILGGRTLGGFLSSLIAGLAADHWRRKSLMVGSDLLRGSMVLLAVIFPNPFTLFFMVVMVGFFSSFFQVSFSAEVPQIFGEEKVLEVNSLISRLSAISMVIGFFASVLLSRWGYRVILGIDAFTFFFSAMMIAFTKWTETPLKVKSSKGQPIQRLREDLKEVRRYVFQSPVLLIVFLVYLLQTFGAGSHNMGIPILAAELDPQKVTFYQGLIWGVWGVGCIVSTTLLPKIKVISSKKVGAYLFSAIFMSTGFICTLSTQNLSMILPFALFTGFFDAGCLTLFSTILQTCDNAIRGRVFGVSSLVNRVGFFIGFMIAPGVIGHLGMAHTVWVFHGLVIMTTLSILVSLAYFKVSKKKVINLKIG